MVSAKALWYGDKNTAKLLETCEEEGPVAFQVFGSDPEVMGFVAAVLDSRENVLLDVNMGCPVPKVVKNGDGSALMRDPDLAGRVVEAMCAKTKKPVTVKIRAGWDAESVNAVEFARVLEAAGAAMVCVHARTREQYYSGKADWDIIARVKAAVGIPVIGNGDIVSREDAELMRERTGCDYVMIGRGALGNPWIFGGVGAEGAAGDAGVAGGAWAAGTAGATLGAGAASGDGAALEPDSAPSQNDNGDANIMRHRASLDPLSALSLNDKGDASVMQRRADLDPYSAPLLNDNGDANVIQRRADLDPYSEPSQYDNGDASVIQRRASLDPLSAPSLNDKAAMFLRHARLTAEDKGEHMAVLQMRKHAGWYFKGAPGSARLRARVNKAETLADLITEVEEFAAGNSGA